MSHDHVKEDSINKESALPYTCAWCDYSVMPDEWKAHKATHPHYDAYANAGISNRREKLIGVGVAHMEASYAKMMCGTIRPDVSDNGEVVHQEWPYVTCLDCRAVSPKDITFKVRPVARHMVSACLDYPVTRCNLPLEELTRADRFVTHTKFITCGECKDQCAPQVPEGYPSRPPSLPADVVRNNALALASYSEAGGEGVPLGSPAALWAAAARAWERHAKEVEKTVAQPKPEHPAEKAWRVGTHVIEAVHAAHVLDPVVKEDAMWAAKKARTNAVMRAIEQAIVAKPRKKRT